MPTLHKEKELREAWRNEFDPLLADANIPWEVRQRMEEWAGKHHIEFCEDVKTKIINELEERMFQIREKGTGETYKEHHSLSSFKQYIYILLNPENTSNKNIQ